MSPPDENSSPSAGETMHWETTQLSTRDLTGKALGDFQVERLLGRGGMGEVYLARQISLNRSVALKVLRPDLLTKPDYLTRFEAEATAVAKLNHPNIVHIYSLGATDDVRFIAMEYVQGTNLREYLRKKGALDFPLALSIMKQAGVAVGAAGELGLVHRDIKPENLLLTKKGQVKVADFGLCRDLDSEEVHLTQPGITMGTPAYMSPEQAQGHKLDHRSDLYSLGVTFYHMLTGEVPFKADSPLAIALKHVKDTPVRLTVHRPDIPVDLERLVLKLMAKSPSARYQSAAEMLRDLARVRESMHAPTGAQPIADVPGPSTSQISMAETVAATPGRPSPAKTGRLACRRYFQSGDARPLIGRALGAALVVLSLSLGAGLGWMNRPEDLLTARPADDKGVPGLWISPRWKEIEKTATAEDQYHWALVRAPREIQDAAWLAVPGYFPSSRDWASRAYTQLARHLLLHHDADRLRVFAAEVDRWGGDHTHEKELAAIIRAGVHALEGELDSVLADFSDPRADPAKLTDPALLELSLEVADLAERVASQGGAPSHNVLARQNLKSIQQKLMSKLFLTEHRGPLSPAVERGMTPPGHRRPSFCSAPGPADDEGTCGTGRGLIIIKVGWVREPHRTKRKTRRPHQERWIRSFTLPRSPVEWRS